MRVKIGETAIASIPVDISYRCSSCRKDNLETQTLTGEAYTGSILGVNLERNLRGKAQNNLQDKLEALLSTDNIQNYSKTAFTCRCRHCGHAEPWAKMNYARLDKIRNFFLLPMLLTGVFALAMLSDLGEPSVLPLQITLGVLFLITAGIYFGINIYKKNHTKKMEVLMYTLPQESWPKILPYSKERHDLFRKAMAAAPIHPHATTSVVYNTWICNSCGTSNSTQTSQCKKCGRYKSS